MALNIYYDKDADLGRLEGKTVAVIGYGSQGHAHAQNLHHSGVDVVVGLRKDSGSWGKAEAAGLKVATVAEAAQAGRHHHADAARRARGGRLPRRGGGAARAGQLPGRGPRLQHPLPGHLAAGGRQRLHGGAEGAGSYGTRPLRGREGRALSGRGAPGSERRHAAGRPSPMRARSAAGARASSRPTSARRRRPISSASRPCSAAASRR